MTREQVDKAWLDVARDAGRQDREEEVLILRAEIERLRVENTELRARAQEFYEAWCKTRAALEPKP